MTPIWKDVYGSLGTADAASYTIANGGGTLYSGRAVKRPDAADLRVRLNDICRDYLRQSLPDLSQYIFQGCGIADTFRLVNAGGTTVFSDTLYMDWSYEERGNSPRAAAPVTGIIDARQPIIYSVYGAKSISTPLGTLTSQGPANLVFNAAQYAGNNISIDGVTYNIQITCAPYALYYVNAYGGWDSLLVERKAKKSDEYKRQSYDVEYDNGSSRNGGVVVYHNEVTRTWELHTAFLTDDQAARMHHLLGSNMVYLMDLISDEIRPVTVQNTGCEYKTYRNSDHQMVSYDLTVALAQTMIRR